VFVFFFLAEYASIVLMCILTSILFIGGYLLIDYLFIINIMDNIFQNLFFIDWIYYINYNFETNLDNPIFMGLLYGLSLGAKSSIMIYTFIWARASFPRIRFDQLMSFCWTVLLPILFAFILLIPCLLYTCNIFPCNINLF
jgi:NADH-ubiquinone oxidoreductase chain 1